MYRKHVSIYGVDVDAEHVQGLRVAALLNLGYYLALFCCICRESLRCVICLFHFSAVVKSGEPNEKRNSAVL